MTSILFTEDQLVYCLQVDHASAFAALYDAYAPNPYGVLLRLVNDSERAEAIEW